MSKLRQLSWTTKVPNGVFDIIVNFVIQKLKSKHTSLKKYTNWDKLKPSPSSQWSHVWDFFCISFVWLHSLREVSQTKLMQKKSRTELHWLERLGLSCLSMYIFWGNERKYFSHISGLCSCWWVLNHWPLYNRVSMLPVY